MSFIEIESTELVGVMLIDEQHQELAESINSIYESVLLVNKDLTTLRLKDFIQALKNHFDTEEKLMKDVKYPGYISHKLEHDRFYTQMSLTEAEYAEGLVNFGTENLRRVRQWFFNHIEINDKVCGKYILTVGNH